MAENPEGKTDENLGEDARVKGLRQVARMEVEGEEEGGDRGARKRKDKCDREKACRHF